MQQKKIIVTGGAGYIGSHTCVELINAGFTPVIIDNFSNSEKFIIKRLEELTDVAIEVEEGDCSGYDFLKAAFAKHTHIEGVIHFAAYKAVGESSHDPLKYYHNNIASTVSLLKVMSEREITNLVFSSSCTVYGQPDQLPVTEASPIKPAESPYGRTKQICEYIISDFCKAKSNFNTISLRYFNPIGAHPSGLIGELPLGMPNNLVPFITQTAAGIRKQLTIFGNDYNTADGTCIRDYIHVVDLAKAHIAALMKMTKNNKKGFQEVYNIGTGKGHSVMEVVQAFEKVSKESLNYDIGPRRSGDVEAVYADVSKAKDHLAWQANLSLEESLKDAWHWQQKLASE